MNASQVILAARDRGIRLSVTKDGRIKYEPRSHMTPELLAAIRQNKTELLYAVYLGEAMHHMAKHYVEGADLSGLATAEDRVNGTYLGGDLGVFRGAVREWLRAGLVEFRRVREAAA